ncbi:MAG: SpoIIE family protein phosphatase [Balneolaceae bacterium]|nr:SpoIIE family protein phosphatase [Balneolaceae bacterium]
MGQRLSYWIFLGAIGFASFFLLRPNVDFNARAPIEESRSTIEGMTEKLAGELGFSVDSLHMLTLRTQHLKYAESAMDSLGTSSLPQLHEKDLFLNGWQVLIGSRVEEGPGIITGAADLYEKSGKIQIRYDRDSDVRRFTTNPAAFNPTFVAGDSLASIASRIVSDIFGYDLQQYSLKNVEIRDTLVAPGNNGLPNRPLDFTDTRVGNHLLFRWEKQNPQLDGPHSLNLEIQPIIRELQLPVGPQIKYGVSVIDFKALDVNEPPVLSKRYDIQNLTYILSFLSLAILVLLTFYLGIRYINEGQVEWKRVLLLLAAVMLGIFGWRAIFMVNTFNPFLSEGAVLSMMVNHLLIGLLCGLYAAMAYIGWEALARKQNQDQLHLIDAFWRKRIFFHETGEGMLRGYAMGGTALGLLAAGLYLTGGYYYQFDSQFGFTEPSLEPKLVTINISALTTVILVSLGHVGAVLSFLKQKIKSSWIYYPTAVLLTGFLFAGSAKLFDIQAPVWVVYGLFTLLTPVIVITFEKAGLFSFFTGWWVLMVVILTTPYMGSSSIEIAYISWVQGLLLLIPLAFAVVAYRYGGSVSELGSYTPEYQERLANHLRVEKEIEIARESQFKLMPLKPPSVPGVDLYGFFLPSFEVGGDYFDYVINRNGREEPEAITMTIADVSGKAMKAAMHAVFTSGLLLSRLHRDHPASILREVAPTLYYRTDPKTFITCIIAQYNLSTKAMTIANAGHCLPILKRNGAAEFIRTPEPKYPLGIMQEVQYNSMETTVAQNDFVLFYSDGLPEAVNPEGKRFGYENLIGLVEELDTDQKTSQEIAMEIKRRVQKFSDYQLADDTTIICLKV